MTRIGLLVVFLLGACSTTPAKVSPIYREIAEPNAQRTAEVVIARSNAFTGGGVTARVEIDQQRIASLRPKSYIRIFLEPDRRYLVQAKVGTMPAFQALVPRNERVRFLMISPVGTPVGLVPSWEVEPVEPFDLEGYFDVGAKARN